MAGQKEEVVARERDQERGLKMVRTTVDCVSSPSLRIALRFLSI